MHRSSRRFRLVWGATAALSVFGIAFLPTLGTTETAGAAPAPCVHRVLVLSAMPLELNPLVREATLDPVQTVTIGGRTFYVGRLAGNDVVLALTGIGLVNAQETATTAFDHFRCSFAAVIFSGVAGSKERIGEVAIPRRWTLDHETWFSANATLLSLAKQLRGTKVHLSQDLPVGDAACLCPGAPSSTPTPVHLPYVPAVYVGGEGESYDTFSGHAIPCVPGGGDMEGCRPCLLPNGTAQDAATFADNAPTVVDPAFVEGFLQPPESTTTTMDAQDEETAAVAKVAHAYRVPFLGIRAASDGRGDPLGLPGFPFQFFVYRQLAGNNAAAVTLAYLRLRAGSQRT